jgi:hypothetical protein
MLGLILFGLAAVIYYLVIGPYHTAGAYPSDSANPDNIINFTYSHTSDEMIYPPSTNLATRLCLEVFETWQDMRNNVTTTDFDSCYIAYDLLLERLYNDCVAKEFGEEKVECVLRSQEAVTRIQAVRCSRKS